MWFINIKSSVMSHFPNMKSVSLKVSRWIPLSRRHDRTGFQNSVGQQK